MTFENNGAREIQKYTSACIGKIFTNLFIEILSPKHFICYIKNTDIIIYSQGERMLYRRRVDLI